MIGPAFTSNFGAERPKHRETFGHRSFPEPLAPVDGHRRRGPRPCGEHEAGGRAAISEIDASAAGEAAPDPRHGDDITVIRALDMMDLRTEHRDPLQQPITIVRAQRTAQRCPPSGQRGEHHMPIRQTL